MSLQRQASPAQGRISMLAAESLLKDAKNGKLSQLYLHRTQFIMFQARDISLVAEGLPSMHEIQGSNPSTEKEVVLF